MGTLEGGDEKVGWGVGCGLVRGIWLEGFGQMCWLEALEGIEELDGIDRFRGTVA